MSWEFVAIAAILLLLFGYGRNRSTLRWGYYGDGGGVLMLLLAAYLIYRLIILRH